MNMYCEGYTTLRGKLHSQILNADTWFTSLSDNEGTNYLLQADRIQNNTNVTSAMGFLISSN